MKRNRVVAPVVVHVRSEASHHPYHHSIGAMFCLLVSLCGLLALAARPAAAQITVGGDPGEVSPADPTTWTSLNTHSQIGINSGKSGTITVAGGSGVSSYWDDLGVNSGSCGAISITGPGSSWTTRGGLSVGLSGAGELAVKDGGTLSSLWCYLGDSAGSSGTAVVTGPGSNWTNSEGLYVGYIGAGTLTVENGGIVTAGTLAAAPSDLKGDGTINAHGLISDMDMVFDGTYGASDVLSFGSGGTLNVNLDGTGELGIGYQGTASLRVADGVKITTSDSYFGLYAGASGTAIVTGGGSAWTCRNVMTVGMRGAGTLRVENGGVVSGWMRLGYLAGSDGTVIVSGPGSALNNSFWARDMYVGKQGTGTLIVENGGTVIDDSGLGMTIGGFVGSHGSVTITGAGSTLANRGSLAVGSGGSGTLTIENGGTVTCGGGGIRGVAIVTGRGSCWTSYQLSVLKGGRLTVGDGGQVTTPTLIMNSISVGNLHVSGDGMIVLGDAATAGNIVNSGKVNLCADAFLAARTYTPITAFQGQTIAWSGTGSYNAFGGTWDDTAKTFAVAAATPGDAGVSCDLTSAERLLITDSASGRRVGASFGTVADGTNFTATPLSGDDLTGLPGDQPLLAAWNFSTNFSGDQALLAFDIGAGQMQDLALWHYDGTRWTPFDAFDLTYGDDGIASFAVTGFGSYAVTVPEPGSMALILLAGLAVRRRKSGRRGR